MNDFLTAYDINLWRDIPILFGSLFVLAASIGVIRFPDLYTRLHASSKLVTLGSAGIYLGVAADFNETSAFTRLAALLIFQFLTTPLSAYLIAQASYLRGLPPTLSEPERGRADEWNVFGAVQKMSRQRRAARMAEAAGGRTATAGKESKSQSG